MMFSGYQHAFQVSFVPVKTCGYEAAVAQSHFRSLRDMVAK